MSLLHDRPRLSFSLFVIGLYALGCLILSLLVAFFWAGFRLDGPSASIIEYCQEFVALALMAFGRSLLLFWYLPAGCISVALLGAALVNGISPRRRQQMFEILVGSEERFSRSCRSLFLVFVGVIGLTVAILLFAAR
jgi:hypothetical protein